MKNRLKTNGLLAFALLFAAACSPIKHEGYTIKGSLKGVDSGTVKLIRYNDDRSKQTLDSVAFIGGTFELNGKLDRPEMLGISISPGNFGFQFFAENSDITITVDTTGARHYDYTAYGMDKGASVEKVTIAGSSAQKVIDKFENEPEQLSFKAAIDGLNKAYEAEKTAEGKENMRPKFDSVAKAQYAWQLKWIDNYIANNPDAVSGAYLFRNYYRFNTSMPLPDLDNRLAKFRGDAKNSVYYKDMAKEADQRRALLPGKMAPDFTLLKRDSTKLTLSSTRGKYVMLDFWASWCKPCREAIPHWKSVYKKYHDKGFEIVSISDDSRWSDWTKAMDYEKMPWTQVIDEFPIKNMPARVGTLYQTHYIPFYVLLDKEGKILVYTDNEKEIDTKLAEVLE